MVRDRSIGPDGLLKSGIKLIGAKLGQKKDSGRKRIYACEPPGVVSYIEPFLGSGAVVVGKRPHPVEIVGDISPYNINFFRMMQERPEELFIAMMDQVKKIEEGGEQYYYLQRGNPPTAATDPVDVAAWYYLLNKYSFNGIVRFNSKGECNSPYCKTTNGRGVYDRDFFDKVRERIADIGFMQCRYQSLLKMAERMESPWVVLDPPYYEVFTAYDRERFSVADHVELRDRLSGAPYKWLLTINDVPAVRELYRDFNFISHYIHYSCSQTSSGRGDNPELIICNYDIPGKTSLFHELPDIQQILRENPVRKRVGTKRRRGVQDVQSIEGTASQDGLQSGDVSIPILQGHSD